MTKSTIARNVGRLAVGAVATAGALVPLGGVALAGTSYGTGPAVNCTVTGSNGVITVSSVGFGPGATYSYSGSSTGAGSGSTFSVVGVPAGSVFSSTVSQGSGATFQSCTSTFTVGGGAPPVTTITNPAIDASAGGGGGSTAIKPVFFTAPVAVAGTTKTTATKPTVKTQVLAKSLTRSGTAADSLTNAGGSAAAATPASSLAFTGSDDIVSGTILGSALVAGGVGFILASRKRSRRRHRRSMA